MSWSAIATMSWFNCAPGSGACQTCNSQVSGIAWPYVTSSPRNYAPCFAGLPQLPCAKIVSIQKLCLGAGCDFAIVDHGPGAACRLDRPPCDPVNTYNRLVDVTPAALREIGGDLIDGTMPVYVDVYFG